MADEPPETKVCGRCRSILPLNEYYRDRTKKDGRSTHCINCKRAGPMTDKRFISIYNGLSSVAKKIYDVIPDDTYWSVSRVANELVRHGISHDPAKTLGVIDSLMKQGLLKHAQNGLFCRAVSAKKTVTQKTDELPITYFDKPTQQPEKTMTTKQPASPFDALREIAIRLLDMSKTINALAVDVDNKIADVEKLMSDNEQDTAKLKQLQALLKSLG